MVLCLITRYTLLDLPVMLTLLWRGISEKDEILSIYYIFFLVVVYNEQYTEHPQPILDSDTKLPTRPLPSTIEPCVLVGCLLPPK